MLRLCRLCGQTFDGSPGASACPDCVAQQRRTTLRPRTCQGCGATFPGGPRAWYCPRCRADRKRQQAREYRQRIAADHVRALGSTAYCAACGQPYTVAGGNQRYCPDCAGRETRATDARQATAWNAANMPPEKRRRIRQAAAAPIPCAICGQLFIPRSPAKTCSPDCSAELRRRTMHDLYIKHKEDAP